MSKFKDTQGKYITQGLFLEVGYKDSAIYTFDGEDKLYKGKTYISIKKRFLEMEDPSEYDFAYKYFFNWEHWKRICANKLLAHHIDQWREELELKLQAAGYKIMIEKAKKEGGFQSAKWLADRGWSDDKAGRPSKEQIEGQIKKDANETEDYRADVIRLGKV